MKSLNKFTLVASCGINCGICIGYLREKNKCPGCRAIDSTQPITRINCRIKNCQIYQTTKAKFCFECERYPCKLLKHLDKRYRTKYNMSEIENLEQIKKYGIKKFLVNEKLKWTCKSCGGTICVHRGYCHSCGQQKQVSEIT